MSYMEVCISKREISAGGHNSKPQTETKTRSERLGTKQIRKSSALFIIDGKKHLILYTRSYMYTLYMI